MPEIIKAKPKVPKSGELPAGTSKKYKTGNWRIFRPEIDHNKCIRCGICYKACPEGAIKYIDGKMVVDLDYCKGCGLCVKECPVKAVKLVKETNKGEKKNG